MSEIDKNTSSVIDELFVAMQGIFTAFKQAWPTQFELDEAKYQWTKAFIDVGLHDAHRINLGIKNCRLMKTPFPPSVGQFIDMCCPSASELGVPPVSVAYREACIKSHPSNLDNNWSHQVVYHAWYETGSHFLATHEQRKTQPVFERNFEIALKQFTEGKPLRSISKAIQFNDKDFIQHKDIGRQHLSEMLMRLKT